MMKKIFLSLVFLLTPQFASAFSFDQFVLRASRAPILVGVAVKSIRVFATRDGASLHAVPFQIDEKVWDPSQQSRVYALNKYFSRRTTRLHGDGRFNRDDELVLDYASAGVKLNKKLAGYFELETYYGGKKIYYYIKLKPGTSLGGFKKKVQFNPQLNLIQGRHYVQAMQPENPLLFRTLKLLNTSNPVDILDHFKIEIHLGLGKFISADVDEGNLTSQRIGYKSGILRTILRVESYKKIGPLRISPKSLVEFVFSPKRVEILGRIENPMNPERFSDDSLGNMGLLLSHEAAGMKFFHSRSAKPFKINFHEKFEKKVAGVETWVLTGSQGHFLVRIEMEPKLEAKGFVPALLFRNGKTPYLGYSWDMKKFPKGAFRYKVSQAFPDASFQIGQEKGIFNKLSQSPTVKVRKMTQQ